MCENDAQLDEELEKIVKELKSSGPNAMATVKSLIHFVSTHDHTQNVAHVQRVFDEIVQSEEAAYGIQCFLQKKQPDWKECPRSKL